MSSSALSIVTLPDPVLRAPTKRVGVFDADLATLIEQMRQAMYAAEGIGLAAPQIGKSLKLAMLEYDPLRFGDKDANAPKIPFLVIANPKITHYGAQSETLEEGCLSVPEVHAPVPRATEVHVLVQDAAGQRVRIRARGLLARILQHEIDHLNGMLIVDRTTDRKLLRKFQTRNSNIEIRDKSK